MVSSAQNCCPIGHRNDPQDEERQHIPLTHADVIDEDERTVRRVRDERDKAVARGAGTLVSLWTCWECGLVFRSSNELLKNQPDL